MSKPLMHGRPGKYAPLCQYLEQAPAEQQSVRLSFAELEALVGDQLPPSAFRSDYWGGGDVARKNWQRSGWHARIDQHTAVLFTRAPAATPNPAVRRTRPTRYPTTI